MPAKMANRILQRSGTPRRRALDAVPVRPEEQTAACPKLFAMTDIDSSMHGCRDDRYPPMRHDSAAKARAGASLLAAWQGLPQDHVAHMDR